MANMNIKDHAKKGGRNRWLPKATHEGILKLLDKKTHCIVLEDGRRIISLRSVFKTFNSSPGGGVKDHYPRFVPKNLYEFINEQDQGVLSVVQYIDIHGKESTGYSSEIIPIVCSAYMNAYKSNKIRPDQGVRVDISEKLIFALSKVGIIGLV